jgi:hypothetical protein
VSPKDTGKFTGVAPVRGRRDCFSPTGENLNER